MKLALTIKLSSKWIWFFVDTPLKKDEKASGPPRYILQNEEHPPPPPCDCGKKHSCYMHVMQLYDCWSLQIYGMRTAAMSWIMQLNWLYHNILIRTWEVLYIQTYQPGWIQNLEVMVQKLFEPRRVEKKFLDPFIPLRACSPIKFEN